jgi:hypothetical protein
MKISIVPISINLSTVRGIEGVYSALVTFDVTSDLNRIRFEVVVAIPEGEGPPAGLDEALRLARKHLADFGRSLAEEADREAPITLDSPKSS